MRETTRIERDGERIFEAMVKRAGGLPTSLSAVKALATEYGIELEEVRGQMRFEAALWVDRIAEKAVIRYNAGGLPSLQMLWIWHEIAEFVAVTAEPALFDDEAQFAFDGSDDPRSVRHRAAVASERYFIEALRQRGFSTRIMERRHKRPTSPAPLKPASPPTAAPPTPAQLPPMPRLSAPWGYRRQSGRCHCGCENSLPLNLFGRRDDD